MYAPYRNCVPVYSCRFVATLLILTLRCETVTEKNKWVFLSSFVLPWTYKTYTVHKQDKSWADLKSYTVSRLKTWEDDCLRLGMSYKMWCLFFTNNFAQNEKSQMYFTLMLLTIESIAVYDLVWVTFWVIQVVLVNFLLFFLSLN